MNNILIITGGNIDEQLLTQIVKEINFDAVIAVDKGLEILEKLQITPTHIIGDFDSVNNSILQQYENKKINIYKLNPEKDFTDTHMAIKLAEELKGKQITILGATGTRIDHTLANIHILKELLNKGINAKLIDKNNEIQLINSNIEIAKNENYKYISLIPLTSTVQGVTLKGMKYGLNNATLTIGESIGISNEQIDNSAFIEVKKGILILIKSKD